MVSCNDAYDNDNKNTEIVIHQMLMPIYFVKTNEAVKETEKNKTKDKKQTNKKG